MLSNTYAFTVILRDFKPLIITINLSVTFEWSIKSGLNKQWCIKNFVNYRGMSRAVEIYDQFKKLAQKMEIPIVSSRGMFEYIIQICTLQLHYIYTLL